MIIQSKLLKVIFFLVFVRKVQGQWINDVIKCLKNSEVYQTTIFINSDDVESSKIYDFVNKILKSVPSKLIDFKKVSDKNPGLVSIKGSRRTTTIFLIIQFSNKDLYEKISFLDEVFGVHIRPRCLVILFEGEEFNHEKLLRYAWSKNFLDFTILKSGEIKNRRTDLIDHQFDKTVSLHYFNPFSQNYINGNYSSRNQLFPDKLKDMKGFEVKVGTIHLPPSVHVKRNTSGYPIEVSGPQVSTVKILSEIMNFKISEVSTQMEWFGKLNCDKNKTTGLMRKLTHSEINFFTNLVIAVTLEEECAQEFGFGILKTACLTWVVPILKSPISSVSLSKYSILMGVIITSLVLFIWVVLFFLKFDMSIWTLLNIVQAVLGFAFSQTPNKCLERIVFCFIIFAFWIYSSAIYAILTEVKVTEETEPEIETLEDLYRSKFTPILRENTVLEYQKTAGTEIVQALLNKSFSVPTFEKCFELLLKNENITCIIHDLSAKILIEAYKHKYGRPMMKLGKECIFKSLSAMDFAPGSPFIEKIDQLLSRLIDFGFLNKWQANSTLRNESKEESSSFETVSRKWYESENFQLMNMKWQLYVILAVGYILSIVVFIGEIFMKHIKINCRISLRK